MTHITYIGHIVYVIHLTYITHILQLTFKHIKKIKIFFTKFFSDT